jgi:hypothetical protein
MLEEGMEEILTAVLSNQHVGALISKALDMVRMK